MISANKKEKIIKVGEFVFAVAIVIFGHIELSIISLMLNCKLVYQQEVLLGSEKLTSHY